MSSTYILMTMDCESAKTDVSAAGMAMSSSGPADYAESARSIEGYVNTCTKAGYPVTLFLHPEVAESNADLVLRLQKEGACLGLHLHPYKLRDSPYSEDLGAYAEDDQREILGRAVYAWESALNQKPQYFRAGYFSANDTTFRILEDLGFRGAGLSNPGRSLVSHFSVWKGAEPYPHRANTAFRLAEGTSDLIEIPVAVAYGRPVARGHAGESGFEWPYIPHAYDHEAIVADVFGRFVEDRPAFGTFVTDTHNDHDYSDPHSPASQNLDRILNALRISADELGLNLVGTTIEDLCDRVREA